MKMEDTMDRTLAARSEMGEMNIGFGVIPGWEGARNRIC